MSTTRPLHRPFYWRPFEGDDTISLLGHYRSTDRAIAYLKTCEPDPGITFWAVPYRGGELIEIIAPGACIGAAYRECYASRVP